jgi:hypothetical protein
MANCKRCGVSVGCGCQLTNGMCASCVSAVAQQQAIEAAQAIAQQQNQ